MEPYSPAFYEQQRKQARRSAGEVVPLVLDLMHPLSVIDVGCGAGTWLMEFREHGVEDIWGVDGDYVDEAMLEIPRDRFIRHNLERPLELDRTFDLVVSLEVAEHLPECCAVQFVADLTSLGSVVLFSAAIPYQGGTHHVNEQWPDYWAARFEDRGFLVVDCIRSKIWNNENVEWWYAQNSLIFVEKSRLRDLPVLQDARGRTNLTQLAMVHPRKYLATIPWAQRVQKTTEDLAALIPPDACCILVDQQSLGPDTLPGRRIFPFIEHEGQYWGPPPDDATAIRELERLRRAGAEFVAFVWPALWWLDEYRALNHHLRSEFPCIVENDRLVVFDVRG